MASTPTAPSAQSFLHHLGLSHDHNDPHYHPELSTVGEGVFELPSYHSSMTAHVESYIANNRYVHTEDPTPPQVGPVSFLELHDDSYIEVMRTMVTMSAPTLAMMELWLRLFALIVGPLCILLLIYWEIMTPSSNSCNKTNSTTGTTVSYGKMITAVLAVASSAVVFTDSLYVYEYGREFGSGLFVISSLLGVRLVREVKRCQEDLACVEKNRVAKHKVFTALVYGLIVSTVILFARSDGGHAMRLQLEKIPLSGFVSAATTSPSTESYNPLTQISDPGIDLPTIQPGFYHSSNPFIQSITRHWEESSRSYNISTGATPYLVNGDQRTGIPFLLNKVDEQEYIRVYVRNPFDDESIALDIAFAYSSTNSDSIEREGNDDNAQQSTFLVHKLDKPVYLILHGLNGGSHEEYVKDFVSRRRSEGSTVIVMIARGMMDTSMKGWNAFHGARTGDVDIAARAVRRGLEEVARVNGVERQVLSGVGYSMGAIIMSNYVARSGRNCALDSAVAVSGGLDMRQQLNFRRSMRLWQPMLTFGLRGDILLGKYARHYKHRLSKEQFLNLLRVTSISVSTFQHCRQLDYRILNLLSCFTPLLRLLLLTAS
jgi:predicted alpha/beta-fold hydrolase